MKLALRFEMAQGFFVQLTHSHTPANETPAGEAFAR